MKLSDYVLLTIMCFVPNTGEIGLNFALDPHLLNLVIYVYLIMIFKCAYFIKHSVSRNRK